MSLENILKHVNEHKNLVDSLSNESYQSLEDAISKITFAIKNKNKIFWCGNGGSCAEAQHLAAEFVGRFEFDRIPLPSIALNSDTSTLTCISNDFGYDYVFSRQLQALGSKGDIIFVLSTSGKSKNIINVLNSAKKQDILSIGMFGDYGSPASKICDISINFQSKSTARIQEMHSLFGHIICDQVEINLNLK